jgi:DnaJ-class molecular chaperone
MNQPQDSAARPCGTCKGTGVVPETYPLNIAPQYSPKPDQTVNEKKRLVCPTCKGERFART